MTVAVDICNSALIKLGQERINSLTEDKKTARLCNEQYPKVLRRVLRSHPWNFALKRFTLAPSTETLEWGEGNIFLLPTDCVRVYKVDSLYPYKIEGNKIISEEATIKLLYVSDAILEGYFDASFAEAIASWLAADLCYALTQSGTLKDSLLKEGEFWIAQARSVGAQEQSVDNLDFDLWHNSRMAGHWGDY